MDLGTIQEKLYAETYTSEKMFTDDVMLVFDNSITYNPPQSQPHIDAQILKSKFLLEYPNEESLQRNALLVPTIMPIWQLLWDNEHSMLFRYPVNLDMYPDYAKVIANPIDLSYIKEKIEKNYYPSLDFFLSDIRKIFNNCYKFNKKGTIGHAHGRAFESFFNQIKKVFHIIQNNFSLQPPKTESIKVEKSGQLKAPVLKLSFMKPKDETKETKIGSEDMDVDSGLGENQKPIIVSVDKPLKLTFKKPKLEVQDTEIPEKPKLEVQDTKIPDQKKPIKLKLNFKTQ